MRLSYRQYAAMCRMDFAFFVREAFRVLDPNVPFLDNWHIHAIANRFQRAHEGELTRLLVCIPPRHLKSIIGSVCFPAWVLGLNPSARLLCASYAQDLSESFAHQTRRLMTSSWYCQLFPQTRFDPRRCTKSDLGTTRNGHRLATSVGGTITGKGGDYIIIDDPMKASDAGSEVIRGNALDWFDGSITTRLDQPKTGRIIVIAQRLHVDDLPGVLVQRGGWHQLILPLIAQDTEVTQVTAEQKVFRQPGKLLHEARIGQVEAQRLKVDLGTRMFEAQYNQRPVPAGGYLFKREWLRYIEEPINPHTCEFIVQSWDTAYLTDEKNDYSVCATFAKRGDDLILLDIYRDKIEFPQQIKAVERLKRDWHADVVIFEGIGSGMSLYQTFSAGRQMWAACLKPKDDKVARAERHTPKFEQRRIVIPRDAPWRAAFEEELMAFPHGRHDDQVDAVTQFLQAVDLGTLGGAIARARRC